MSTTSSHEDLVNKYIRDYFKDMPNSTGLNKEQGNTLIAAIKSINKNEKTDPGIKRRIKNRLFTLNDKEELLCDNVPVVYVENYFDNL
jgi:hypothetical protein